MSVSYTHLDVYKRQGWHCGRGKNGSANDTHISFEICEDGLEDASYFKAVYQEAVELTAYLCKEYNLSLIHIWLAGGSECDRLSGLL